MSRIILEIKSLLTPERKLVSLLAAELEFVTIHSFIHLLYSINPSLETDTTGCGTCQ